MRTQNISEILYRHDPGNTCCNVNEDMEDEYDGLAAAVASVPVPNLTPETFRAILADSFSDFPAYSDGVPNSYEEILNL